MKSYFSNSALRKLISMISESNNGMKDYLSNNSIRTIDINEPLNTIQNFWDFVMDKMKKNNCNIICIRFRSDGDWTPNNGWFIGFIMTQNIIPNDNNYDACGRIILTPASSEASFILASSYVYQNPDGTNLSISPWYTFGKNINSNRISLTSPLNDNNSVIPLMELKRPNSTDPNTYTYSQIYQQKTNYGSICSNLLTADGQVVHGTIENPTGYMPYDDESYQLGTNNHRWKDVYSSNSVIQTSDRNAKHDITNIDSDLALRFIGGLKPCSYKLNKGTSNRTHYGLIAQDVEDLLENIGLSSFDFAGLIKSPKYIMEETVDNVTGESIQNEIPVEGEYVYSLRYDEFIAPMITVIQNQQNRIDQLEELLTKLQEEINELKK